MPKRVREKAEHTNQDVSSGALPRFQNDTVSQRSLQVSAGTLPPVSVSDDLMVPHPQYLAKLFAHSEQPKTTRRMLWMHDS